MKVKRGRLDLAEMRHALRSVQDSPKNHGKTVYQFATEASAYFVGWDPETLTLQVRTPMNKPPVTVSNSSLTRAQNRTVVAPTDPYAGTSTCQELKPYVQAPSSSYGTVPRYSGGMDYPSLPLGSVLINSIEVRAFHLVKLIEDELNRP